VPRPSLPSSSGPGRRPLTAKTGVRVPLGAPETSGIIGFSAGLRLGYPGGLSGRLARLNEGGTLFMASRARVSRRMKDSPALMRGLGTGMPHPVRFRKGTRTTAPQVRGRSTRPQGQYADRARLLRGLCRRRALEGRDRAHRQFRPNRRSAKEPIRSDCNSYGRRLKTSTALRPASSSADEGRSSLNDSD
jgi:hypothetical protein